MDYTGGDPGCSDPTDVSEVSPVLALVVTGTSQGGSVTVMIAGVEVILPTPASAIEQNPALREVGTTAFAQGNELWIADPLDSASTDDPGLTLEPTAALSVPAMGLPAVIVLGALLTVVALAPRPRPG